MKFLLALSLFIFSWMPVKSANSTPWQTKLQQELPLLGHRNWIVVVDSAYPLQTSAGIETVETGTDELTVVREVLHSVAQSRHVRPVVFMDAELPFVTELQAPGVKKYRGEIKAVLGNLPVQSVLHAQLIQEMNQTSNSFQVLILKTTLAIPYTSVFLRLDCKYWSDADEQQLREEMKHRGSASSASGVH
jgi:D-ribose pyranose/furanose isomerase RbsD